MAQALPDDLAAVVKAWAELPQAVRKVIVGIVRDATARSASD